MATHNTHPMTAPQNTGIRRRYTHLDVKTPSEARRNRDRNRGYLHRKRPPVEHAALGGLLPSQPLRPPASSAAAMVVVVVIIIVGGQTIVVVVIIVVRSCRRTPPVRHPRWPGLGSDVSGVGSGHQIEIYIKKVRKSGCLRVQRWSKKAGS